MNARQRSEMRDNRANSLPAGIIASDCVRPTWDSNDKLARDVGDYGELTLYNVRGFGWCIATLAIAKGRNNQPARTYAIRVDTSEMCRVGQGPHVLGTITVYVKESRREALRKFIAQHKNGLSQAGQVRDRISSRRAQGQLERAQGRRSWRWNV